MDRAVSVDDYNRDIF